MRAGLFAGRTGSSTGGSAYLEVNPFRHLGFCAFLAQSRATSQQDGGTTHQWDLSAGGCITAHAPELMGFLLSPFAQLTMQHDHDRFTMPLGDGTFYSDGQDRFHRLWTAGVTIDRAIMRGGPRWAARVGENFGGGPAAEHAGGLYLVGGVIFPLDHPVELGRSFGRLIGRKPQNYAAPQAHP